jgi:purine nucleosidase
VYRRVDVDTVGIAKGESIADFRPQPDAKSLKNWVRIGWSLHYKKFLEDFVKIMT